MPSIEQQPWQVNTARLAREISEAAAASRTEEDLKMRVEPLFRPAFEAIGLPSDLVRYEQATTLRGRTDALYGYLVIEYKAPGRLGTRGGLHEALVKIQEYMEGEAVRFGPDRPAAMEKFVGVCLDGRQIAFVRFSRTDEHHPLPVALKGRVQPLLFPDLPGFQILGPFPVDDASLAALLVYARAAGRRSLTASGLAEIFGPGTELAQQTLSTLYTAAKRVQYQKTPSRPKRFFQEWDRLFGVIYGQDIGRAEQAAEETARLYGLPGGADLKPLLFSIHTYYAFLMKLIAIELLALQPGSASRGFAADLAHRDDDSLSDRLARLESGDEFRARGIVNFLEHLGTLVVNLE